MTVSTGFRTRCDLCARRMAAMPGPMNGMKRPPAPDGYRLGYVLDLRNRVHTICADCLHLVLTTSTYKEN